MPLAGRRYLRHVAGQVLDVRESCEHAVRRGSDVLRVLVFHLLLLSSSPAGPTLQPAVRPPTGANPVELDPP
jgi:hypothetical protein